MVALREEERGFPVSAEVGINAPDRPLAVLCEAPGAQEAATSRPLVGLTGRIFDALLYDAGIDRRDIVILNRVRCRPPHNRLAEAPGSIEACDEWLMKELEAYRPAVVLAMGGTALTKFFGTNAKVGQMRGVTRTITVASGTLTAVATYHPASLLPNRSPENRPLVIEDMKLAVQRRQEILWLSS